MVLIIPWWKAIAGTLCHSATAWGAGALHATLHQTSLKLPHAGAALWHFKPLVTGGLSIPAILNLQSYCLLIVHFINYVHFIQNTWDQKCFGFQNCISNEISWKWDPSLNTKFICVFCIPCTHSLKGILWNIFNVLVFFPCLVTWGQMWKFPFVLSHQHSKNFHFAIFWNWDFQIRETQPVLQRSCFCSWRWFVLIFYPWCT